MIGHYYLHSKMTERRWAVLSYLANRYVDIWADDWARPTHIGVTIGKKAPAQASQWACSALSWLVDVGYVTRHKYQPMYRATLDGVRRWREGP